MHLRWDEDVAPNLIVGTTPAAALVLTRTTDLGQLALLPDAIDLPREHAGRYRLPAGRDHQDLAERPEAWRAHASRVGARLRSSRHLTHWQRGTYL
jgi:hypothetical protein